MEKTKRRLLKKAFKIIRRNFSCPGSDGISISDIRKNYSFYEDKIISEINNNIFAFDSQPKCLTIKDYLGKERKIFVYNVIERWVQEFIKLQIEPSVEQIIVEYTYAFRRKKSDLDSYRYILKDNPKYILRIDIKDYFSSINKDKLFSDLENIKIQKDILELIKKSLSHCGIGLPPGNVLSCMLSNFSLHDFDILFPNRYTRFSDDMMFGCDSAEEVDSILDSVRNTLKNKGFLINEAKTRVVENPTQEKLL